MGTHDEQRNIRGFPEGMEVSFAAQREQIMRRASGFNQLYEYLSIKEVDPAVASEFTQGIVPPPVHAPPIDPKESKLPPMHNTRQGSKH